MLDTLDVTRNRDVSLDCACSAEKVYCLCLQTEVGNHRHAAHVVELTMAEYADAFSKVFIHVCFIKCLLALNPAVKGALR